MSEVRLRGRVAAALTAAFLALITLPAFTELLVRPGADWARIVAASQRAKAGTGQEEKDLGGELARESQMAHWARQAYQALLTVALGEGSSKVVVGRAGWLFLREDVQLCTGTAILGREPEPRRPNDFLNGNPSLPAIVQYARRLSERDIHLVVLPIPVGPVLYPEYLWSHYPVDAGPAWGVDFHLWKKRLAFAGVDVLDVTEDLWKAKKTGAPVWAHTNTRWTPRGIAVAAAAVAAHIQPYLAGLPRRHYTVREAPFAITSDLYRMLDVEEDQERRIEGRATQVLAEPGGEDAPVLLLGDSYSCVYNGQTPGQVAKADLGRQLMLHLGLPVQTFAKNGADPTNQRDLLEHQTGALDAKRVVIWEFTTRFLSRTNMWKEIGIPRRAK